MLKLKAFTLSSADALWLKERLLARWSSSGPNGEMLVSKPLSRYYKGTPRTCFAPSHALARLAPRMGRGLGRRSPGLAAAAERGRTCGRARRWRRTDVPHLLRWRRGWSPIHALPVSRQHGARMPPRARSNPGLADLLLTPYSHVGATPWSGACGLPERVAHAVGQPALALHLRRLRLLLSHTTHRGGRVAPERGVRGEPAT